MSKTNSSLLLFIILIFLGAACAPTESIERPVIEVTDILPSASLTITQTATPTETPAPTSTPTPTGPRLQGTPVPQLIPISASNILQLTEVARYGGAHITDMAYSPNKDLIAFASAMGVYFYDVRTESMESIDIQKYMMKIAFSPDGTLLATGSIDSSVHFWDVNLKQWLRSVKPNTQSMVVNIVFSPNGDVAAVGYEDDKVRLWDVKSGRQVRVIDPGNAPRGLSFSPDGKLLAVSFVDLPPVRVFNLETGEKIWSATTNSTVYDVSFSPDGKFLAYPDYTGCFIVDAQTGRFIKFLRAKDGYCQFIGEGDLLVGGGTSYEIFAVTTWQKINTFQLDKMPELRFVTSDAQLLTLDSGMVYLTNLRDDAVLGSYKISGTAMSRKSSFLKFDSNGFLITQRNQTLVYWDSLGQESHQVHIYPENLDRAPYLTLSPDIELSAYYTYDAVNYSVIVNNITRNELVATLRNTSWPLAFSSDGSIFASRKNYKRSNRVDIEIWDILTWQKTRTLQTNNNFYYETVTFSPKGDWIVAASQEEIRVWNTGNWEETHIFKIDFDRPQNVSLLFSPSNENILVSIQNSGSRRNSVGKVRVWDLQKGEQIHTFEFNQKIEIVNINDSIGSGTFSPDGTLFVCGTKDGKIHIWSTRNWQKILEIPAHGILVSGLAFSPDGTILASSSYDGTIRLWGIEP